jgi:methionine biosynthesis protein MetW
MSQNILRPDLQLIADLIPRESAVLDVGCGSGELLAWLKSYKQVEARGLEAAPEGVAACISKGLAVVQGDAEIDLAYYGDKSFDVVVLSRTLQAMHEPLKILERLVDIGQQVIVSIPNFAYWRNRLHLGLKGRMPVTRSLTYQWYDTPNIHFCTLKDFVALCKQCGITIHQCHYLGIDGSEKKWPLPFDTANLLAEQGVFVISRK